MAESALRLKSPSRNMQSAQKECVVQAGSEQGTLRPHVYICPSRKLPSVELHIAVLSEKLPARVHKSRGLRFKLLELGTPKPGVDKRLEQPMPSGAQMYKVV